MIVNLDMIQIDGSVNMGNSGGPLIHMDSSSVVGIVSVRMGSIERDIQNLKAMPEVAESRVFAEIVSALERIDTYLNPGIGQAVSIDYAHNELITL
jgi:S1-C subfamily serine protease